MALLICGCRVLLSGAAVVDCDVQPLPFENVMLLRRCSWSGTAVVTALL